MNPPRKKHCGKCGELKPLAQFTKAARRPDGLNWCCRGCQHEYYMANRQKALERAAKYHREHQEEIRARRKDYHKKNRDRLNRKSAEYLEEHRAEILAKQAEYREAHREELREKQKQFYREHRAERLATSRRWAQQNPEKVRALGLKAARKLRAEHPEIPNARERKRRARKAQVGEDFSPEMAIFVRHFWENRCAVCGAQQKRGERQHAIDHWLPLSKGYPLSMENAVLLCNHCNPQKSSKLPLDMYDKTFVDEINSRLCEQSIAWKEMQLV